MNAMNSRYSVTADYYDEVDFVDGFTNERDALDFAESYCMEDFVAFVVVTEMATGRSTKVSQGTLRAHYEDLGVMFTPHSGPIG